MPKKAITNHRTNKTDLGWVEPMLTKYGIKFCWYNWPLVMNKVATNSWALLSYMSVLLTVVVVVVMTSLSGSAYMGKQVPQRDKEFHQVHADAVPKCIFYVNVVTEVTLSVVWKRFPGDAVLMLA